MITREYTVWCDDKRHCPGEHLTLCVNNQGEAIKYARKAGWAVRSSGRAMCPECLYMNGDRIS